MSELSKKFLTKKIISIFVVTLLILAVPLTVLIAQQQQTIKQHAAETTSGLGTNCQGLYTLWQQHFGATCTTGSYDPRVDLGKADTDNTPLEQPDGFIDIIDYGFIRSHFQDENWCAQRLNGAFPNVCIAPTSTPIPTPTTPVVPPTATPIQVPTASPLPTATPIQVPTASPTPITCTDDSQCSANQYCNRSTSRCQVVTCTSSTACPIGSSCNTTTSTCQQTTCNATTLCPIGSTCNTTTAKCIRISCTVGDTQCPSGTSCDTTSLYCTVNAGGATTLALTLGLSGVGLNGGNPTPLHSNRTITVQLYGLNNALVSNQSGTLTYDMISKTFKGTINLTNVTTGQYYVKAKIDQYLQKVIPGLSSVVQTITTGAGNQSAQTTLVVGDINGDNKINLTDYNLLLSCFGDKSNQGICKNPTTGMILADLDDSGVVDGIDYNLLIRSLSSQSGD